MINGQLKPLLKRLSPYFASYEPEQFGPDEFSTYFENLLFVAQNDLSFAHCIQHNQVGRLAARIVADIPFESTVGAFSSNKSTDTVVLRNNTLTGTKTWLSNLSEADYCTFYADNICVYVDLSKVHHKLDFNYPKSIGMQAATPGSITFDPPVTIPNKWVISVAGDNINFIRSNYTYYSFITTHLGIIIGLFNELNNQHLDASLRYRIREIELEVSALQLLWKNNLISLLDKETSNEHWEKRHTQYALSKKVLLNLIHFVLEVGLHHFVEDTENSRFKDALTFATHMKPYYQSIKNDIYFDLPG